MTFGMLSEEHSLNGCSIDNLDMSEMIHNNDNVIHGRTRPVQATVEPALVSNRPFILFVYNN